MKRVPISTRTVNSVRGALYDLRHYDQLPPVQSGAPVGDVITYVTFRDGRFPFILMFLTMALIWTALVVLMRSIHK